LIDDVLICSKCIYNVTKSSVLENKKGIPTFILYW